MKIRTVIVDDEAFARASLLEDIHFHCPSLIVVGEADSVKTAVPMISKEQPSLVFLDIRLGDGTGFDVLEQLGEQPDTSFVFTTAYDQYAIRAFRYAATDYLLKPINADELKDAVNRVNSGLGTQSESVKLLLSTLKRRATQDRVAIPTAEGIHLFNPNEIVRCQSESNYTRIFLQSGEKLIAAKTLKDIEELLADFDFERVHSSHLVNLDHIKKYLTRDGGVLVLSDNAEVPVSQRKKAQILDLIRNIK
jgi:two-component system, LytTR family, response regulator